MAKPKRIIMLGWSLLRLTT